MSHLDTATLDALLDGSLPAGEARDLLAHLDAGCDACEDLLAAEGPDLDTLHRLVEAERASPAAAPDLWAGIAARRAPPRRRWPWVGAALALAAAVILAVLPLGRQPGSLDRSVDGSADGSVEGAVKGGDATPVVQLKVVEGRIGEGGVDLGARVEPGDVVPRDRVLLFELDVDQPGARYLFVVDGAGGTTLLAPTGAPHRQPAGAWRAAEDGQWVALAVDDLEGPLQLVAVAGPVVDAPDDEVVAAWQHQALPPAFGSVAFTLELGE